jgi:hypothetical protein
MDTVCWDRKSVDDGIHETRDPNNVRSALRAKQKKYIYKAGHSE